MSTLKSILVRQPPEPGVLRFIFALVNPVDSSSDAWAPASLDPPGYFVHLRVLGPGRREHYASPMVTVKLKLHPRRPESYVLLSPGQVHGLLIDLGEADLPPGKYTAVASYDNREFTGTAERPVGRLELTARTSFEVAGG